MRGTISTLLVTLGVAVLLIVASLPQVSQNAAAQNGVMEVEPNDSREEAQQLDLVCGANTIQGAAARGEGASFVEELEILFQLGDPMEDWYFFDVEGVIDFGGEVGWPEASDVDSWLLAEMSDFVFFDGLVSYQFAASLANPETYSRRLYYTYSNREDEVDEDPQPTPDASRYYLVVSNFDDGMSPPTDYTVTIDRGCPCGEGVETRTALHDTGGPGFFTTVEPSDFEADSFTALERVTPSYYPAAVNAVSVFNFSGGMADVEADLIVLVDPDGTGDPANATEAFRTSVTIPAVEETTTFRFDITEAGVCVESGDIYVGFSLPAPTGGVHIPFDIDKAGFRRSFISTDSGATFSFLVVASNDVGIPFISNSGITAEVAICADCSGASAAKPARARRTSAPKNNVQQYEGHVTISMKE